MKEVLAAAARALGLAIQPWEVRAADDFEKVFSALNKERRDGLYVAQGQLMQNNQNRITNLAAKSRLPSVGSSKAYVDAGGLMSYGGDLAARYRRVAYFVDRILKGAKPHRSAGGAADEVRAGHQSQNGEADRINHPAERAGAGG